MGRGRWSTVVGDVGDGLRTDSQDLRWRRLVSMEGGCDDGLMDGDGGGEDDGPMGRR